MELKTLNFFFSADNNWYRAVVLEVGDNEMSVIYADYGNSEKVPFSRILPITKHLLQLPFQITRCTLTGKTKGTLFLFSEIILKFQTSVICNRSSPPPFVLRF